MLELPPTGAVIGLHLGFKGEPLVNKGRYTVDEVEHGGPPDTITLRARSADISDTLKAQHTRAWHQVTLGDLVTTIDALLKRYPKRHFILVGDSGEQDPEVYGEIARRHPQQVDAIYIHNVTGESVDDGRMLSSFAGVAEGGWSLFGEGGALLGME